MRKMNFLKTSLKCGVLSSNLLNCSAMEKTNNMENKMCEEKKVGHLGRLKIIDCTNVGLGGEEAKLEEFEKTMLDEIKNNQPSRKLIDEAIRYSNVYRTEAIHEVDIDLNKLSYCCGKSDINFAVKTENGYLKKIDCINHNIYGSLIYKFNFKEMWFNNNYDLNNLYVTTCCGVLLDYDDIIAIEKNIIKRCYDIYKFHVFNNNELLKVKEAETRDKLYQRDLNTKIILPNTCIVCQETHKKDISYSDSIEYLDLVNNRFVDCNKFDVYPFYKKAFINTNINK